MGCLLDSKGRYEDEEKNEKLSDLGSNSHSARSSPCARICRVVSDADREGDSLRSFVLAVAVTLALATTSLSQEVENNGKGFVGFTNISVEYGTANVKGVTGSIQFKVIGDKGVRLEAVADTTFLFAEGELLQTYLGGSQVSLDLAGGRFNPFARLLYGASIYEKSTLYTHSAGLGVDFRITRKVFFRGTYDRIDIKGIPPFYRTVVGIGREF